MACLRSRIDALANDECRQEVLHEAMGQVRHFRFGLAGWLGWCACAGWLGGGDGRVGRRPCHIA